MNRGFVVETASIYPGFCVKKGTAENGVVLSDAGEAGYGISNGTSYDDVKAVGEHVDVALPGEVVKVKLGATLTAGDSVAPEDGGKVIAMGTADGQTYFRAGILLESGVEDELVDCLVTSDYVTVEASLAETPTIAGLTIEENGKKYVSAYSTGARAVGDVVMLTYSNTAGQEVTAADAATSTFPVRTAVAATVNAGTELSWFQVEGIAEASVDGTDDVAAGDFLEVLNTADDFIKDGTSRTTVSGAIAVDAQTTDAPVVVTVVLIGEQHTIAAS